MIRLDKTLISLSTMNKLLDLLIEYNVYQIQQDTSENDLYNFLHRYTTSLMPSLSDQVHLFTSSQGKKYNIKSFQIMSNQKIRIIS
jgi:hypothetical protein